MSTEKDFQAQVLHLCSLLGLLAYHTYDSRMCTPGFPDLVIVGQRVLFRELKTDKGRVTHEQETWLQRLSDAGADAAVWRPSQWDAITVELRGLRKGTRVAHQHD